MGFCPRLDLRYIKVAFDRKQSGSHFTQDGPILLRNFKWRKVKNHQGAKFRGILGITEFQSHRQINYDSISSIYGKLRSIIETSNPNAYL